jgi:hypothetical protein
MSSGVQATIGFAWVNFSLALSLALAANPGRAAEMPGSSGPDGTAACGDSNGPICVGADSACQFTDLQDAIDSVSETSGEHVTIHVAGNQEYDDQRLFVFNQNLTLVGGYSSCTDASPGGTTTLHGVATGSVISIGADAGHRSVELEHLEIRGGGGTDPIGFHQLTAGGGVFIRGDVEVTVRDSEISDNAASIGGGIYLDGAELTLDHTIVGDNAAHDVLGTSASGSGGGILCERGGMITMDGGQIVGNVAVPGNDGTPRGGGVFLDGCEFSGTASGEAEGVWLNFAQDGNGGGFYVTSSDSNAGALALHGTGAGAFPLRANIAGRDGGGLYADSAVVALDSTAVNGNQAGFSTFGSGGGIHLLDSSLSMDSQACAACSGLEGNSANSGSAIYGFAANVATVIADIDDTRIVGNDGGTEGPVIQFGSCPQSSTTARLRLHNDLIVGNTGGIMINVPTPESGELFVSSSTIADNDVAMDFDVGGDTLTHPPLLLYNNIIREPDGIPIAPTQDLDDDYGRCVITNTFGANTIPDSLAADPQFIDPEAGDYHLQSTSPAIDFCTVTDGVPDDDLDGNPRGVDAPLVPPFIPVATFDLGAYEWQVPADRIFASGFGS